jgi:hypothetical protein
VDGFDYRLIEVAKKRFIEPTNLYRTRADDDGNLQRGLTYRDEESILLVIMKRQGNT